MDSKKIGFGCLIIATLTLLIAPVHAQGANVSLLYGYNTTAWVPLRTLPDGAAFKGGSA